MNYGAELELIKFFVIWKTIDRRDRKKREAITK